MSKENVGTQQTFGSKICAVLYTIVPIRMFEWKKFLPMSLMMACILFVYNLLRDLKDTLIITKAVGGAAECISFLKLYGVTIFAILFMIVFNYLRNKFDSKKIFYSMIIFFLAFFAIFGFVLYPMAGSLHMSEQTIKGLQASVPALHWFWPVIGNWTYSLFYIMSELWGSVVLSVLFWQFANDTTKVTEAKRFYGLYALIGNMGPLLAGVLVVISSKAAKNNAMNAVDGDTFASNLRALILGAIVVGVIAMLIYGWMRKNVLTDPKLYDPNQVGKKKKKVKMGFIESIKLIAKSPYLLLIAVLVLSYGVSINLIEAVWKGQLKLLYPDSNDFSIFMGKYSISVGILTSVMTLLGTFILRKSKWRTSALITPIIILILGSVFFGAVIYKNGAVGDAKIFGLSILFIAVIVGAIQNCISKSVKYSLFDSTKNMAYIPLDPELKTRGQAAVEAVGGRFGKAGGALIQQVLFACFGGGVTLASLVGIIGPIVLVVLVAWLFSVCGLSKKFEALVAENKEEAKEAEESEKVEATVNK